MTTNDLKNEMGSNGNEPPKVSDRKEFGLSSFSIDNRISVLVLILLIAVLGIVSYVTIPKESFPNITVPNIFVVTIYPGVSPEDMESLITRKLEDELSNISDVKKMTSTSSEGYSSVNLEFNTGIDIDEALQKVREKGTWQRRNFLKTPKTQPYRKSTFRSSPLCRSIYRVTTALIS